MKVYSIVILLCFSSLFISQYEEAQATPTNNQNNFNDPKFGGIANQTLQPLNKNLSDQTAPLHKTLSIKTLLSFSDTSTHTTPSNIILTKTVSANKTSTKTTPENKTLTAQDLQLLENQYLKTGNDLFDQGNYTDAITYYDKALVLNSTDINALYNKALSLDNLGRLNEAITSYNKVLIIHPNDADALNNAGLALDALNEHTKAITYYDKVLSLNPEDTDALYNKGVALEELGKKDDATLYYKKVLDVNPNDTAALNKLNLTFNNANATTTAGIHKEDQTLITIVAGVFVAILIGIIMIDRITKRRGHESGTQIMTKTSTEMAKTMPKDSQLEEIGDEERMGI